MIIDAHQHFWRLSRGDYGWLTPALAPLYRDFAPKDLQPLLKRNGIDGTILVQAAPTVAETEYLVELADAFPFILGVVGWVDFEAQDAPDEIARLSRNPKLVGLRPMIQNIESVDWILRDDLTPAIEAMIQHNLTFDALVLPRHLRNLRAFLLRHPNLQTVIDHGAKPDIKNGRFRDWADDITALAADTDAYCKLSGLLTEARAGATMEELAPYLSLLYQAFGPKRLIWGSDWPVLTLATDFDSWLGMARTVVHDPGERKLVFGQNASAVYKLEEN